MKVDLFGRKASPVNALAHANTEGARQRILAQQLQWELAMLAARRQVFPPGEFSDGQWQMLARLYVAQILEAESELMTKDVLQVSGLSQGTAWRHLKDLQAKGAVKCRRLEEDGRRVLVKLSPECAARVEEVVTRIMILSSPEFVEHVEECVKQAQRG